MLYTSSYLHTIFIFLLISIFVFNTVANCAAVHTLLKMCWNKVNTFDVIVCQLMHVFFVFYIIIKTLTYQFKRSIVSVFIY